MKFFNCYKMTLLIASLLMSVCVNAQATLELTPQSSSTYLWEMSSGTLSDVTSVTATYTCTGGKTVSVDPAKFYAEFASSWLCDDGNCDVSYTITHDDTKIHITIFRTDNKIRSGSGRIAGGGGIILIEPM